MPKVIPASVWKTVDKLLRAGHSDRAVSDLLKAKGHKVSVPSVGKYRREHGIVADPLPSRRVAPAEHRKHKPHAGTKYSPLRARVIALRDADPKRSFDSIGEEVGCSGENARQLYSSR